MVADLKLSHRVKEALVRCLQNQPEIHFAMMSFLILNLWQ
jgi:hypothetical protein